MQGIWKDTMHAHSGMTLYVPLRNTLHNEAEGNIFALLRSRYRIGDYQDRDQFWTNGRNQVDNFRDCIACNTAEWCPDSALYMYPVAVVAMIL